MLSVKMSGDSGRNSDDLLNSSPNRHLIQDSSPNDVLINNNNNNNKRKIELDHDIDTDGSALSPRKHLNTGNSQVTFVLMEQDELHSDNEVRQMRRR